MRRLQQQAMLAFLTASMLLVGALPLFGRKNLNDLDKIGHRNVAHHCIISPDKEAAIGKQYAARFEQSVEIVKDPEVQRYVTKVAEKVAHNSDWKGPVMVRLVNSPEANSFSFPAGFIYLSSGMMLKAANENEIAGVVAHQLAHAAARHWASEMTRGTILQFSMITLYFIPGGVATACTGYLDYRYNLQGSVAVSEGLMGSYMNGVPLASVTQVRKDELEADYLGLQYMYKAGYDPSGYVDLLRKLAAMQPASPRSPDLFQAIPPYPERIAKAEEEIRELLPDRRSATKPSH